jgi:hypothetical protein
MDWLRGVRPGTRLRVLASVVVIGLIAGLLLTQPTWSAFSATTGNPANSAATGTVALTDNDAGSAMFSLTDMTPGTSATSCIKVTYSGSLPALVHLYQTSGGTGLGSYLELTITRGTLSSAFADCSGFSADTTDYAGLGQGILYSGALASLGGTYAAGLTDPRTAAIPEIWTANEAHAYKLTLTLRNNDSAQTSTVTPTFTWEARNSSVYSDVILSDQPASYWKLDEAAGTTATDAMGVSNGTHLNGVAVNQTSGVKNANKTVTYDGIDDRTTLGDIYSFSGMTSYSAEFWVKPSAPDANYRRVLGKELASPGGGWCFYLAPTSSGTPNGIRFSRQDASGTVNIASGPALTAGTWYHIVGTWDGFTIRLYVNAAAPLQAGSAISLPATTGRQLTLGADSGASNRTAGSVDEVAIYTYVLSATQVTEHYDAGHM